MLVAQVPLSESEIKSAFQSKGVSQELVQEFLDSKGMTSSELQNLSPEQYIILDRELDAFIASSNQVEKAGSSKPVVLVVEKPSNESVSEEIESNPQDPITENTIRRYGDQLFINNEIGLFEEGGNKPVPGNYVLNVGDEVRVSIYGISKLEKVYPIQEDGSIIYNKDNRKMYVAGLSLNEVRTKVEKVFKQYYVFRKGEINVDVLGARTVTINLYGEVAKPGGYVLSAVNSPLNALIAAKGITENGSYRNIRLLKDDGIAIDLDLYKFLEDPSALVGLSLSNNDVIHVPSAKKVIKFEGSVKRPIYYELKSNENLADLLKFAGGYKVDADKSRLRVIRYEESVRKAYNITTNSPEFRSFKLIDGDIVNVAQIESEISNIVSVDGAVNNQGLFELSQGMQLSDLVSLLVMNSSSRTDLALINRTNADGSTSLIQVNLDEVMENKSSDANIQLQQLDKLLIWSKQRFTDSKAVFYVSGAVREPGNYPYANENVKLSDVLIYSGGLRRDAGNVGMIYRKDPLNKKNVQYIIIDPETAENDFASTANINIMAYDSIVILAAKNIQQSFTVSIEGEVRNPGVFQYGSGMTLKELVVLANGFNLAAQTNQIEINRTVIQGNKSTEIKVATVDMNPNLGGQDENADKYILKPFDKVYVRTVPDFELPQVVTLTGQVKYPGNYVLESKNERLMDLIERAGGLTKEAFMKGAKLDRKQNEVGAVVMNLEEATKSSRSKYNYILKPRDVISIPKQEDIVTLQSNSLSERIKVEGIATNTLSIAYFPGKNAKFYVNEFAGGFGENADRAQLYVEHANGEIGRTRNYLLFNKYPKVRKGSLIVIPEKPVETEAEKSEGEVDWTQLLNDSVAQAMSILTLLLLVERL